MRFLYHRDIVRSVTDCRSDWLSGETFHQFHNLFVNGYMMISTHYILELKMEPPRLFELVTCDSKRQLRNVSLFRPEDRDDI